MMVGLGLLFSQIPGAFAIYSPVLSKDVSRIKQDVFAARQMNGVGTWVNAMEKIQKNNKELQKQGQASGISGTFPLFSELAKKIVIQAATESFLDGFKLLIPAATGISTCLRDDIWELQALQEEVLNEMFKSSLLSDLANSQTLFEDYKNLQSWIEGGDETQIDAKTGARTVKTVLGIRKNGSKKDNKDFWFPDTPQDYYVDCPFGSITMAIEDAKVSLNRMIDTFSGNFGSMGSIDDMWNIAKKRAVQDAAAYIAKNQIKISLGGDVGANPEGLINGNGLAGLSNTLNQAKILAKDAYLELLTSVGKFLVWGATGSYTYGAGGEDIPTMCKKLGLPSTCAGDLAMPPNTSGTSYEWSTVFQDTLNKRQWALDQIYAPITLGAQLNFVSEESLKDIESTMVKINLKIQEGSNQKSIPDMCSKLNAILNRQCNNKAVNEPVNCMD